MNAAIKSKINDIKNRPISVIGLGRSGNASAKLAQHFGAKVFVSDNSSSEAAVNNLKNLSSLNISGETDGHTDRVYETELVVLSPGVPMDAPIVKNAIKRKIKIVGEVEFAGWFTNAPIIAVTGSNGKSTTVHILAKMCQSDTINGVLAGNIGTPFAEKVLEEIQNPDPKRVYVLEISSFQMEFIDKFHPYISIFLNITPDHLDRHYSLENYLKTKLRLAENQNNDDYIIYNADDEFLPTSFEYSSAKKIPFSMDSDISQYYQINNSDLLNREYAKLTDLKDIGLPGRHNLYNLLAAATGAHILGVSDDTIGNVMRSFKGIPHRLERITLENGVEYINDSKATNVASVKVALASYTKPIILILGGKSKGNDFTELLPLADNVRKIIAYGDARTEISLALAAYKRTTKVKTLKDAVAMSHREAVKGDIVLLSPACASFDQFRDFEERGEKFAQWVRELKK